MRLLFILMLASSAGAETFNWQGASMSNAGPIAATSFTGSIDFSTITTSINTKATSGANSDITSLSAIKTISSAWTSTSSGTINAAVTMGTTTLLGGNGLKSLTIAQLRATTPQFEGQEFYCSNCSPKKVVVSTGNSPGNFADAVGAGFK